MAVLIWEDEHVCFPSGRSIKISSKTVESLAWNNQKHIRKRLAFHHWNDMGHNSTQNVITIVLGNLDLINLSG